MQLINVLFLSCFYKEQTFFELTLFNRIQANLSIYVKYQFLWCENVQNDNQLRPTLKSVNFLGEISVRKRIHFPCGLVKMPHQICF